MLASNWEILHSTPLFKNISLFQKKKQFKEVAKPNNLRLPTDAFNAFEEVYGKFVSAANLRLEYLQFANTYFEFEKLVILDTWVSDDQNTDED